MRDQLLKNNNFMREQTFKNHNFMRITTKKKPSEFQNPEGSSIYIFLLKFITDIPKC